MAPVSIMQTIVSAVIAASSEAVAHSKGVPATRLLSTTRISKKRTRPDGLITVTGETSVLKNRDKSRVQQRRLKKYSNTQSVPVVEDEQETMTSNSFLTNCTQNLLSSDNLVDGLLSQDEYAAYLYSLCTSCDATTGFVGLPTSLQLSFLFAACSSEKDFDKCLEGMMEQEKNDFQFGFQSKSKTFESDVGDLCTMIEENINTLSEKSEPTSTPTNVPTKGITKSPTALPTNVPTVPVTGNPTMEPSVSPTKAPTQNPSTEPTLLPTGMPSNKPNDPPTEVISTSSPSLPPTVGLASSFVQNVTSLSPSSTSVFTMNTTSPTSSPSFLNITTLDPTTTPTVPTTESPTVSPTATTTTTAADLINTAPFSVSVTFSYRVTLDRELTASKIGFTPGVDNTVALDLLNGLMTVLRSSQRKRLLAASPLDEKYSNPFVNHNIFFDVDECPTSTTHPSHRCVIFLDTVAFDTTSTSEEEQAQISQHLLSKVEGSMSPMSSQLIDVIANDDIVDIFFVGDGQAGRASENVGIRTTIDRIDQVSAAGFPVPSYAVIVVAALVLVLAAAFLVGRNSRRRRHKEPHESRQLVESMNNDDNTGQFAGDISMDDATIATQVQNKTPNFKKPGAFLQFDPRQEEGAYITPTQTKSVDDDEFLDDATQVASNVSGRSSKLIENTTSYSELVTPFSWEDQEETSSATPEPKEEGVDVENNAAHESNWFSVWNSNPKLSSSTSPPKSSKKDPEAKSVESPVVAAYQDGDNDHCGRRSPPGSSKAEKMSKPQVSAVRNVSTLIDDENIEVLERLIENDDWDCFSSGAMRFKFSPELSTAGEDFSQQAESESEASASDSELCSNTVDDADIKVLEDLIEHDDWHGLSSAAKRYHQQYGSVCSSSSCGPEESSQSECAQSFALSNASSGGMEVIDDLIEQGNWEELAKFASNLAQVDGDGQEEVVDSSSSKEEDEEDSSAWNDESYDLEIGTHVDLTSAGTNSTGSESDANITNLGFLESMAELSKSELDRSGSEGADMAAEWAISRSLTEIVNYEKSSSDLKTSALKEKCDMEV